MTCPPDITTPSSGKVQYFTGKAGYYAKYRPGYPPGVFLTLIDRFALHKGIPVLDLGCGTGNVAISLAEMGVDVFAVDPDPGMLGEAKKRSYEGSGRIAWIIGSDAGLAGLGLPPVRLCTMGLSFHWMDRPRVLAALDTLIEPGGGIACISRADGFFSHLNDGWGGAVKAVLEDMLGESWDFSGRLHKKVKHEEDRHEDVFVQSPFSVVESVEFPVKNTFTVDEIIGQQLSTSYIDPVLVGERNAEFRDRLTRRLLEIEPSGTFSNESVIRLLIARRP